MRTIALWRDKDQHWKGKRIIWVVLALDNIIETTLNAADPHTDLDQALAFARKHARRLKAKLNPNVKDV